MRKRTGVCRSTWNLSLSVVAVSVAAFQQHAKHVPRTMSKSIDEIIDFIASGTTPERVASFRTSEESKAHVAGLIRKEKTTGLSLEETAELNTVLQLEHIMRLAKVRARRY